MGTLSDGIVHTNSSAVDLRARTHFLCLDRILDVLVVDERKSSRASRLMIVDDLQFIDRSKALKDVAKVTLLRVQAQTKHAQTATCSWMLPVALMTAPV